MPGHAPLVHLGARHATELLGRLRPDLGKGLSGEDGVEMLLQPHRVAAGIDYEQWSQSLLGQMTDQYLDPIGGHLVSVLVGHCAPSSDQHHPRVSEEVELRGRLA